MGFRSLIAKQVQGAVKILGTGEDGLASESTYLRVLGTTYNPTEGRTQVEIEEYPAVAMVLTSFKIEEMDDQVAPTTDMKALIPALNLPLTPQPEDLIEMANGLFYEVKRVMGVPGDSLYILHVRRTAAPPTIS